jgi:hypothetical protein
MRSPVILGLAVVVAGALGAAIATGSPRVVKCPRQAGGGIAIEACDPAVLASDPDPRLHDALSIRVKDPFPRGGIYHSGSTPGFVQVIGEPVSSGTRIYFTGRPSPHMEINIAAIQFRNQKATHYARIVVKPENVGIATAHTVWTVVWRNSRVPHLDVTETAPRHRVILYSKLTFR